MDRAATNAIPFADCAVSKECPKCGGNMITVNSWRRANGNRLRRMKCKACDHRITIGEDGAEFKGRRFDDDTIRAIRSSDDGRRVLAKRYHCSQEMIRAICAGLLYRDLLPEGFRSPPGPGDPSCERCCEWLGTDASHPCRFGFPEVITEGPGFARDCSLYVVEG